VNGGTAPGYVWTKNGLELGETGNTYKSSNLKNGDIIQVKMTSNSACAKPDTVSSNAVAIVVNSQITPSVTIATSTGNFCQGEEITFTATPVNGGTAPGYVWTKNGVSLGETGNIYRATNLKNGDIIKVKMSSNAACAKPDTVSSNAINVQVGPTSQAYITIDGNTDVIEGQSSLITTHIMNGGQSPSYQWQDSTQTHSWQNIAGATGVSLNYTPQLTGDAIRCLMTSSLACVQIPLVTSNNLTFTIRSAGKIAPNPVNDVLTVSLDPNDHWEILEIANMNGGNKLIVRNVINQSSVSMFVNQLPAGVYVVILKRSSGENGYLKFIKL
jgi:flagellar biosynthesis/type III secretory pathway chaperone